MKTINIVRSFILPGIALFLLVSCTTTKHATVKNPKWLQGEWKGVGLQLNSPQTWTMELTSKDKHFLIFYPTLDCGGEWDLISATSNIAVFQERIIKGVNLCVQGGKVIVTRVDENHISFSYFSPDSGKLEAHSTLVNIKALDVIRS